MTIKAEMSDYLELPKELRHKHSLINIKNDDCCSILYSIKAGIMKNRPRYHKEWLFHYNIKNVLCVNVSFPTEIEHIPLLEEQNNLRVTVFNFDKNDHSISTVYISQKTVFLHEINLLVLRERGINHFVLIANLDCFLRIVKRKTDRKINLKCNSCKVLFKSKLAFNDHKCMSEELLVKIMELKNKRGLFGINCKSNELEWSITAAIFIQNNATQKTKESIDQYKTLYQNLNFPNLSNLDLESSVEKICEQCKINVNIFIYENKKMFPFIVPQSYHQRFCDILLVKVQNDRAFFVIKNLASIYPKAYNCKYICRRCLQMCFTKRGYKKHQELCLQFKLQKVKMGKAKQLKFKNIRNQVEVPFVVYSDFESMLVPVSSISKNRVSHHVPIAVSYKQTSYIDGETKASVTYVGLDCVNFLIDSLISLHDTIKKEYFDKDKEMIMTLEDELDFASASTCKVCNKPFEGNRNKIKDHDHFTGKSLP